MKLSEYNSKCQFITIKSSVYKHNWYNLKAVVTRQRICLLSFTVSIQNNSITTIICLFPIQTNPRPQSAFTLQEPTTFNVVWRDFPYIVLDCTEARTVLAYVAQHVVLNYFEINGIIFFRRCNIMLTKLKTKF